MTVLSSNAARSATTDRIVSITVHVATSGRREAEIFLYQPEAAVVDMGRDERAGAERDDEQLAVRAGPAAATGATGWRPS